MSYHELGLRCGLEIHQQLEGKKLFCSCPTHIREDAAHFRVQRKLRASAGESGKTDIAALSEQQRNRLFLYEGYHDTTCLVELDEEPPHEVNKEALYTSLQLSALVKAKVTPIVQVMRKTIIDGSATSGFQRTALIGREGTITSSQGKVRIANISLEEDSCKIVSEDPDKKIYRVDRLGIPLIEIGTHPDITTPEQCQETAKKIGYLLRSLPGVKRGLGTIRQDVNVSIRGGARVEIKGAQDLHKLPLLVEIEAKRQQELLRIRDALKNISLNSFDVVDVTSLFLSSQSSIIRKTLDKKGKILALKLTSFTSYVGCEIAPNIRLGSEFSNRAKISAGVGGIFHSDELPNYGITEQDVALVKKNLNCKSSDAFILVADDEKKAHAALVAVYLRAQEALTGVPSEVRKANADGTTSYLRPMPGASRMYPETDVPLIYPILKGINLPETLDEKTIRYQQTLGLSRDLADFIAKSDRFDLFEELVTKYPSCKPAFIAETLISSPVEIKRNYALDSDKLSDNHFRELFLALSQDKIHKDIVLDVLMDMIKGTYDLKRYASLGTEAIHKTLKEIIAKNPNAPFSALMGLAMKELAGKASGQFISEQLKRMVESGHK